MMHTTSHMKIKGHLAASRLPRQVPKTVTLLATTLLAAGLILGCTPSNKQTSVSTAKDSTVSQIPENIEDNPTSDAESPDLIQGVFGTIGEPPDLSKTDLPEILKQPSQPIASSAVPGIDDPALAQLPPLRIAIAGPADQEILRIQNWRQLEAQAHAAIYRTTGRSLQIVHLSTEIHFKKFTEITFRRDEHLQQAFVLAQALPNAQLVRRMTPSESQRSQVDLMVLLAPVATQQPSP